MTMDSSEYVHTHKLVMPGQAPTGCRARASEGAQGRRASVCVRASERGQARWCSGGQGGARASIPVRVNTCLCVSHVRSIFAQDFNVEWF